MEIIHRYRTGWPKQKTKITRASDLAYCLWTKVIVPLAQLLLGVHWGQSTKQSSSIAFSNHAEQRDSLGR
jgi:hypothetical protein